MSIFANRNLVVVCIVLLSGLFQFGKPAPTARTPMPVANDYGSQAADFAEAKNWEACLKHAKLDGEVTATQADGMTALHWAAAHGSADTTKALLALGAKVDAETIYQITPLSLACEFGHAGVVKHLLAASANVEHQRLGRERPLLLASRQGDAGIVKMLIAAGADLEARERNGQTALMWAAGEGNERAVDALIAAGADLKYQLKSGFSPIMFAARQGKTDCVMRLLDAGIDVNEVMVPPKSSGRNPRKKMSALMLAVESGHFELALKLVARGADPNDQRSGFAPLHAISWVRRTKRGDDPDGDPPPRTTGAIHSLQFVREMVAAGADVNLALEKGKAKGKAKLNPKGATPFFFAASTCDLQLMELLVELGAEPKTRNADGCTALMAASGVGVIAVGEYPGTEEEVCQTIRMLLKAGLDLNVTDSNGETAMHGAAYRTFPAVVNLLAECGANPEVWNKKNVHGWTPHAIAGGKRPGSVKPSPETIAALDTAVKN